MIRNTIVCRKCGNQDFKVTMSIGGQIRLMCQKCGLLTAIALCISDPWAISTLLVNNIDEKELFDEEAVREIVQEEISKLRDRQSEMAQVLDKKGET